MGAMEPVSRRTPQRACPAGLVPDGAFAFADDAVWQREAGRHSAGTRGAAGLASAAVVPASNQGTAAAELDLGQGGEPRAPEAVRLLPSGEIRTRPHDRRDPWHNTAPQAVVDASRELKADLPIDYDHQTEFAKENGREAPAAGWIKQLYPALLIELEVGSRFGSFA